MEKADLVVTGGIEDAEQNDLQKSLLRSFSYSNVKDIERCKELFLKKHPYDADGVDILFGLVDVLKNVSMVPGGWDTDPENSRTIIKKISFAQQVEKYLVNNSTRIEFLENFWSYLFTLAERANIKDLFIHFKNSIIIETAAFDALASANLKPVFPDPEDDFFFGIDLEIREGNEFVQIKGTSGPQSLLMIVDSDELKSRGVAQFLRSSKVPRGLDQFWRPKLIKFLKSVSLLHLGLKKDIRSHFIIAPYGMCDHTTGRAKDVFKEAVMKYFSNH